MELDLQDKGLGVRSRRYAMLLEDGVVSCPPPPPPMMHCGSAPLMGVYTDS